MGLERIYESDTEFSYILGVDTPQYVTEGAITWRYDGQQLFSDEPTLPTPSTTYVEPDYVLTGPEFDSVEYFAGTKVDQLGRRWMVESVDVEVLAEVTGLNSAADNDSLLDLLSDPDDDGILGIDWNADAGAEHEVELTSWTLDECNGGRAFVQHNANGDLTEIVGPIDDAGERRVVNVNGVCSGALLTEDAVLTAAHCVTDANGNEVAASTLTICALENLQTGSDLGAAGCTGVADMFVPNAWAGTNPYKVEKDWALLWLTKRVNTGLTRNLVDGVEWAMEITEQSDADVEAATDHLVGMAYYSDTACNLNRISDDCQRVDQTQFGRELWRATGEAVGTPVGYVKWHTSFGRGLSGAPHYLCPAAGPCDRPEITGIQAATQNMCGGQTSGSCATGTAIGPKAKDIRASVIAQLTGRAEIPIECPALEAPQVASVPFLIDPADFSPTCQFGGKAFGLNKAVCGQIVITEPNSAVHPLPCAVQGELVVYLPGTGTKPSQNKFPQDLAAFAGFRTIGLSYLSDYWVEIPDFG